MTVALVVILVLAVAPQAGAAVTVGHSGWYWGNPTPQGNSLGAIDFAGSTGYAAGDFGTLVRTTDAGVTWTGLRTGVTIDLNRVDVIDADSVVVAGTCAIRRTDDAGESFRRLPFTRSEQLCSRRLADMSFPDPNSGYLVLEDGSMLATADGGRSFSSRDAVPGTQRAGGSAQPTSILFVTVDRGFATTSAGRLYRTVDGGREWTQVFSAGSALTDVFVSGASGAVVGDNGVFAHTSNGGDSWTREFANQAYALGIDLTGVRCAGGVCLMPTRDGGLARTDDDGRSFLIVAPGPRAADFVSPTRAVAVGVAGITFISDDRGESFTPVSRRLNVAFLRRMRATSSSVAHVPGADGALARTTDGGQTWVNVGVATSEAVLDSSFPTADRGYALDVEGGLFRTENGGSSWGILDTGTSARPNAVFAPDATVVLLVGPEGIRRSIDGGDSFGVVRDSDVRRAVDRAGGAVVAFGARKIAASGNRGRTWTTIPLPRTRRNIRSADFVSAKAGFVLLSDGRVFSTRNAGGTWRESLAVGSDTGSQLAFNDSKSGWLVIGDFPLDGAHVLRTSNGGASWRPQLLGDGAVGSVAAAGTAAGFVHLVGTTANTATSLLATGTGGDAGAASSLTLSTRRTRLPRRRTIEITGRLKPARGGEQIVIGIRRRDRSNWDHVAATAARDGTFSIDRRVARTTLFVAQWRGDEESAGAGSGALTVRVQRR
jgi:photosystem II stability/assembly factor-like uncharacterized protein